MKGLLKSILVSIHVTLLVNAFIQAVYQSNFRLLVAGFILLALIPLYFDFNIRFGGKNK